MYSDTSLTKEVNTLCLEHQKRKKLLHKILKFCILFEPPTYLGR